MNKKQVDDEDDAVIFSDSEDEEEEDDGHETSNHIQLKSEILENSKSNNWNDAVKEWELESVYHKREGTCICGHKPITERCVIRNTVMGNVLEVGNVCVKKFDREELSFAVDKIVSCITRSRKKTYTEWRANREMVELFHDNGVLNDWEYLFYTGILKKRKLSSKQHGKFMDINSKLYTALLYGPKPCVRGGCNYRMHAVEDAHTETTYWMCKKLHTDSNMFN